MKKKPDNVVRFLKDRAIAKRKRRGIKPGASTYAKNNANKQS